MLVGAGGLRGHSGGWSNACPAWQDFFVHFHEHWAVLNAVSSSTSPTQSTMPGGATAGSHRLRHGDKKSPQDMVRGMVMLVSSF
jgi:hypothetical protein